MPSTSQRISTALAALFIVSPAYAQDSRFSAKFSAEFEIDSTFESDDPLNEITDTFVTIEGALSYQLTDRISINSTLLIEPVEDAVDDRFLEDHGVYAEELFLSLELGKSEIIVGKFNPAFGTAWDAAPGIYGVDFAEDYEITERVGAAINFGFDFAGGAHEVQVAVFQADRSFLSDSLGTDRGQLNLSDGGVSNTAGIESVSISLSGRFGDTGYNIGLQSQGAGVGDADDQTGVVIGVTQALNTSVPIELLGEVAYFDSFDGTTNSATIATIGASAEFNTFTLSGVAAIRDVDGAPTDRLYTVSAEREFANGLTGAVGYRYGDEGGVENNTLGLLLAYEF
ncbi:MAG: hypothetical protein ABJN34_15530 [Litoreibacter sp.]|uniref:hypothetical protein n=1 Tax=Litoreibacter sp. TaxID=1969459 RepID=UPI0032992C7E